MKILINDHGGYPFPIQLSRRLAMNGYSVVHCYSDSYESPRGNFTPSDSGLRIIPVSFRKFNKYSVVDRIKYEGNYAAEVIKIIKENKFDIVVCANNPLVCQDKIQKYCIANKIKFILWCHDIRSIAISKIFIKKISFLGYPFGYFFKAMEKRHLRKSDAIINITEDFNTIFVEWGIDSKKLSVIPNWAPIDELPLIPKENAWARQNKLNDQFCILYSGTLGLKHNPALLTELAKQLKQYEGVKIVIISEGNGVDFIAKEKAENNLDNIVILPFQDFEVMPMILGTADIVLAVLEADAGVFSVPSKVLTYLCSAKPIVLSVPPENLSSRIVKSSNAGLSVPPDNFEMFVQAVKVLYEHPDRSKLLGSNGRHYAEENFDIAKISKKFEAIFSNIISN